MRILILANNDLGLFRFRKDLIQTILSYGNEVYISLPNGDFVEPLTKMGCVFVDTPVDRRGMNIKNDISLFRRYRRIIKETNPDFVITYTIKPNIYGGIASSMGKRQYAANITGLGSAFEKKGILRFALIILHKIALKKAKVVFVENSGIAELITDMKMCRKEQIVVVNGAGVDLNEFNYQEYPAHRTLHFLFVGRVMKDKGVDELLAATKRLVKNGYDCVLDIVGPFEEDYAEAIKESENEGWLNYYGFQKDVRPFISDCDCFVLPSYHEGMANTNLESASSGRPVITSDIPGCKESVVDGKSGFLIDVKNVDSLYNAMAKISQLSMQKRRSMGLEGRKHMEKVFDKRLVVEKTINSLFKCNSMGVDKNCDPFRS